MNKNWVISLILLVIGIVCLMLVFFSIKTTSKETPTKMNILGLQYTNHFYDAKTKMNVYWRTFKNKIDLAIQSPGQGWVGIGFNPKGPVMNGADIFMGFVKNGKTYMSEEYANTPVSHEPISSAGGKDCVLSYKGASNASGTTIAFTKSLTSCGKFDTSFVNKPMTVMLAYSDGKDFTRYHGPNNHDIVQINFLGKNTLKKTNIVGASDLDSYQIGFLAWGMLFLISGIIGFASLFTEKNANKIEFKNKDMVDILPASFLTIFVLAELILSIIFIFELYSGMRGSNLGLFAGFLFLLMAFIVLFFRKLFIDDEVIAQDINDEIPW